MSYSLVYDTENCDFLYHKNASLGCECEPRGDEDALACPRRRAKSRLVTLCSIKIGNTGKGVLRKDG